MGAPAEQVARYSINKQSDAAPLTAASSADVENVVPLDDKEGGEFAARPEGVSRGGAVGEAAGEGTRYTVLTQSDGWTVEDDGVGRRVEDIDESPSAGELFDTFVPP